MKKIVFVLSSVQAPHSIKRIIEAKYNGFECNVYGFVRDSGKKPNIPYTSLGEFTNGKSYLGRIKKIFNGVRFIKTEHKNENCIYYCFGFEIALFIYLLNCRPYIYESSDLMYSYFANNVLIKIFKAIDRLLVKKAKKSVFTSEGFITYLFNTKPANSYIISNKLDKSILQIPDSKLTIKKFHREHIIICFAGILRFKSLITFAEVVKESFPNITLRFHGRISEFDEQTNKRLVSLYNSNNIEFYGEYATPFDLPHIYKDVDIIMCCYDTDYDNVRFAEPNKLYESTFFKRPIIVSKNTFLSDKVNSLGIGFSVDINNKVSIKKTLKYYLTENVFSKMQEALSRIPDSYSINSNDRFFSDLKSI